MKHVANVLVLVPFLFASSASAAPITLTWIVDGKLRQALVFVPPPNIDGSGHPLVFFFHGHGGSMQMAATGAQLESLWPEAIVVYPQGLDTPSVVDPAGSKPGWQVEAGQLGDRDLKFFDAMVATLQQTYFVDTARIYASGFSNGAI